MTVGKFYPPGRSSCGKIRYRDEVAAKLAMAEINRLGDAAKEIQRTYRCQKCRGFHLTSKP